MGIVHYSFLMMSLLLITFVVVITYYFCEEDPNLTHFTHWYTFVNSQTIQTQDPLCCPPI